MLPGSASLVQYHERVLETIWPIIFLQVGKDIDVKTLNASGEKHGIEQVKIRVKILDLVIGKLDFVLPQLIFKEIGLTVTAFSGGDVKFR